MNIELNEELSNVSSGDQYGPGLILLNTLFCCKDLVINTFCCEIFYLDFGVFDLQIVGFEPKDTLFFLWKNKFYKNIEAQNRQRTMEVWE